MNIRRETSKRNGVHIEAVIDEIRAEGGTIDRIDHRRHWVVYWSLRDAKLITVAPSTSRSREGVRNSISGVRRQARRV